MTRITEVWASNLEQEMRNIRDTIESYPYIAMDTEFPGVVARPIGMFPTPSDYHYQTMRCNVDLLKIIQVGLTLADENGNYPENSTWQFNFQFNINEDMYAPDSIDLLQKAGFDFQRHEEVGISPNVFAELMITSGLVLNPDNKWISFHSAYDFGYFLKLLTGASLPMTEDEFSDLLHAWFPTVYDVKFMVRKSNVLNRGLQDLADELGVTRVGTSHQAGSDSLLAASAFFKMRELYFSENIDDALYSGQLYGFGSTFTVSNGAAEPGRGGTTIAEREDRVLNREAHNHTPSGSQGQGIPIMSLPNGSMSTPMSSAAYMGANGPYMRPPMICIPYTSQTDLHSPEHFGRWISTKELHDTLVMSLKHPSWYRHAKLPYNQVWLDWWGRTDRRRELDAKNTVLIHPDILSPTQGNLFIRQHYHDTLTRLHHAQATHCRGVILSGHPGTGKTYSLYFLLLDQLLHKKPAFFSPYRDFFLYFSEDGVQILEGDLTEGKIEEIPLTSWALINSDEDSRWASPPSCLTSPLTMAPFIVQAASSNVPRWVEKVRGQVWCVARWSRAELFQTLLLDPVISKMFQGDEDTIDESFDARLDDAIRKWGWAPRDLARALSCPESFRRELEASLSSWALSSRLTPKSLLTALYRAHMFDTQDDAWHAIISTYHLSTAPANSMGGRRDEVSVDFTSPYIRSIVMRTLHRLGTEDLEGYVEYLNDPLFNGSSCNTQGDSLAGWVFEASVVDMLCTANRGGNLHLHSPVESTFDAQNHWVYTVPSSTIPPPQSPADPEPTPAFRSPMTIVYYDKTLDTVKPEEHILYLPQQRNFPLLDAFYLEKDEAGQVTVVILQMTVFATHISSSNGFTFLRSLKTHLQTWPPTCLSNGTCPPRQKINLEVSFKYYLVLPDPRRGNLTSGSEHTVTWKPPGKFPEEIQGPVFIQYVPVKVPLFDTSEDESYFDIDGRDFLRRHSILHGSVNDDASELIDTRSTFNLTTIGGSHEEEEVPW
ncbi:hypothetical protein ONZ45_g14237 [Pleurotus djamor]|nr:hypothetical protein ONZ45_g14237 [Pleurotus djamor]